MGNHPCDNNRSNYEPEYNRPEHCDKFRGLRKELKRYEGQPVKIFTDDERVHCGIDEIVTEDGVRIIDKCGRQVFIELAHIDAIVEPQMRLRRCCDDHCDCHRHDRDDNGRGGRDDDDCDD